MAQPDTTLTQHYGKKMADALWSSRTVDTMRGGGNLNSVSQSMKDDIEGITKQLTFENVSAGLLGYAVNKQLRNWDTNLQFEGNQLNYQPEDDELYYLKYSPENKGTIELGANFTF